MTPTSASPSASAPRRRSRPGRRTACGRRDETHDAARDSQRDVVRQAAVPAASQASSVGMYDSTCCKRSRASGATPEDIVILARPALGYAGCRHLGDGRLLQAGLQHGWPASRGAACATFALQTCRMPAGALST
eukprot:scaffold3657_cov210-Prasinococcus_capsulatus_cf.AAC.1